MNSRADHFPLIPLISGERESGFPNGISITQPRGSDDCGKSNSQLFV